ncbi:MinD/ParA family ATP-binding protein [Actinoplanes rectilineatus]|uniref:MinD/ParA family ATP-binding protein n=1 Tax=Actinoplanes rectilineatus TaxID=113571 RepID=UPI0005F2E28F|nr:hypothetical protein [Actinoplanes rectilineatus]
MTLRAAELFPNAQRARHYGAPPPGPERGPVPLQPPPSVLTMPDGRVIPLLWDGESRTETDPVSADPLPPDTETGGGTDTETETGTETEAETETDSVDEADEPEPEVDPAVHVAGVRRALSYSPQIMVANPVSGTGKTTVTAALAATFGRVREVPVLAWELTGAVSAGEPRYARGDGYDVLACEDLLAVGLTTPDSLVSLGRRMVGDYDVLVMDTGDDDTAAGWSAAATVADLVVVAVTSRPEALAAGLRILESMPERSAVAVVSCTTSDTDPQDVAWMVEQLRPYTSEVVVIGFDPVLSGAEAVRYDRLSSSTRQAFLALAATVMDFLPAD